jgi:uncharacterized sulfatase
MFQTPTTRVWKQLHDEGKLTPEQDALWNPKPSEELYDLQNDRDEVKNLANSPEHAAIKAKMRQAQQAHATKIRDVGFVPEGERLARSQNSSPYDFGHSDAYPFDRVIETADLASLLHPEAVPALKKALADREPAVRYWGALGLLMRGESAIEAASSELEQALKDASAEVRITAAQALGQLGSAADLQRVLPQLLEQADWKKSGVFSAIAALSSLDALGDKAQPFAAQIKALPREGPTPDARYKEYVPRLLDSLDERFP